MEKEGLQQTPIFISYKRTDIDKVFPFKKTIEQETGLTCWIDLSGIESDAQFAEVIISAINNCGLFIFMYSEKHANILDYGNDWTIRELSYAQRKGKRIVFVRIDSSPLTDWFDLMFGNKQQINANNESEIARLIKDIKKWIPKDGDINIFHKVPSGGVDKLINEFVDEESVINIDAGDLSYLYNQEDIYYAVFPLADTPDRMKILLEKLKSTNSMPLGRITSLAFNIKIPEYCPQITMSDVNDIMEIVKLFGEDIDCKWGFTKNSIRHEIFIIIS